MANGFVIYPTYRVEEKKAKVFLFGRLESGESFLAINTFRPYFYIRTSDRDKASSLVKADYEDTGFTDFDGNKATKVTLDIPAEVGEQRSVLVRNGIPCFEADIRFAYRFLIDKGIKGSLSIEGEHKKGQFVDRIYEEPVLKSAAHVTRLKTVSIDIETNKDGSTVFSIALYSPDIQTVLLHKEGDFKNARCFSTEKEMLERFREVVLELDPDIIMGWNVVDFDLKILQERFNYYHLPFQLGRVEWPCRLKLTESFFMSSKADFPGRAVLDGIDLFKMSFIKLEDYKLNTAAKAILGEGKLIQGDFRWDEIENAFHNNTQLLIDYNLRDAKLVYDLVEKTKLLDLTVRRSLLTGMQPDRVSASIASLDSLYLRELQNQKIVAPTSLMGERGERIKGGFVRESLPGIYENVLIFDFKSLYPSIIRTFNIDPVRFVPKPGKDTAMLIRAPNGAFFRREKGILPALIQQLWEQRDSAKKERNAIASNAIKILMNSMFGVLANPMCRFYSLEMANAITHFGQFFIKLCAEEINRRGYEVIYGDTDSIFLNAKEKDYSKALELGKKLEKEMNHFFSSYIRQHYQLENFLELEFEKVYKKFLLPRVRGSETGAKKRYAGIIEKDGKDLIDFTGLEFVRRDWTEVAKKFQMEFLQKVFNKEKVDEFVTKFIKDMKDGKYDSLLVYKKAIRKTVKEYTKTTPPHIKAARKAGIKTVGLIEYVMTINGPEPVEQRKSAIDYEHYIQKQIKPLADSVLVFYGKNFDDLVQGHTQATLGDF